MLDIKLFREQPEVVRGDLAKVGVAAEEVDRLIEADLKRRAIQRDLDEMRARRTRESKELGKASPEERDRKRAEMRQLGDRITAGERDLAEADRQFDSLMLMMPNLPRPYVPVGASDTDNKVVRTEGEPQPYTSFKPQTHWDLGQKLGLIDFERGVKLSGTRFYFLRGAGAQLERALIAWMLDVKTREQGYVEIQPPLMVNTQAVIGSAHLPKFEDTMYKDREEDFWFVPTAEVPLTNMYSGEILEADRLPIYLTAYTPCFRREKMSAGRDVRGIKRGHQFDKVEMVKVVRPENSDEELNKLVDDACEICRRLELPYRVIQMCTGDLGFAAAAKYDVEVWAPGVAEWLEVSSCSNCWDFQARRAQIRYRPQKGGKTEFVHTLNGSGLGLPRTLIAVMESYQNEDGSITIPKVLRAYMGGAERITPENRIP